ncbi:transposase [Corynebacterium diphtheriae]|uniref:transposase n=1 Tax=Corynebacterium diphtheriae TaxID=1717 RepID=UPI0002E88803|nr:transposase [Corynebacterium diphtheriae]OJI00375.1 ISL3 family transposase [Corynebacterium diphtheriae]VEJ66254.1 transposase-like protein [Corynebacterium diphtheriae]
MDGFQGYATAAGEVIFNTTQVIDLFHVVHLAGDKPRGRLEKLFDFDDDYALLQQTWAYYQQASSQEGA